MDSSDVGVYDIHRSLTDVIVEASEWMYIAVSHGGQRGKKLSPLRGSEQ